VSGSEGPEPRDGRALRSARTREALVAATMATVAAGEEPTPERIAERAGVSERTIFRLFDDLSGLWEAVRAQMGADLTRLIQLGPFEGDLQRRTRELIRRRIAVFDAIAPYRSWVDAREALYPRIRQGRDALDRVLRAQAAEALAPELAGDAASIAPAIDSLLSYESWRYLRAGRGLGPRQVANLLEAAVLRLVASATAATPTRSQRHSR
jgi:TetR/AcrR family transcriptional regulator of autoinduction and epiphytic fitness